VSVEHPVLGYSTLTWASKRCKHLFTPVEKHPDLGFESVRFMLLVPQSVDNIPVVQDPEVFYTSLLFICSRYFETKLASQAQQAIKQKPFCSYADLAFETFMTAVANALQGRKFSVTW
jgi:hypothetical protein